MFDSFGNANSTLLGTTLSTEITSSAAWAPYEQASKSQGILFITNVLQMAYNASIEVKNVSYTLISHEQQATDFMFFYQISAFSTPLMATVCSLKRSGKSPSNLEGSTA